MFVVVGFFTAPILWIWGMVDANKSAKKTTKRWLRKNSGSMKKQGLIPALMSAVITSVAIIGVISFTIYNKRLIGPVIILLGFVPWILLRIFGRTIKSTGADIVFGAIDTGFLGIAALIGASFAGILGANPETFRP